MLSRGQVVSDGKNMLWTSPLPRSRKIKKNGKVGKTFNRVLLLKSQIMVYLFLFFGIIVITSSRYDNDSPQKRKSISHLESEYLANRR